MQSRSAKHQFAFFCGSILVVHNILQQRTALYLKYSFGQSDVQVVPAFVRDREVSNGDAGLLDILNPGHDGITVVPGSETNL